MRQLNGDRGIIAVLTALAGSAVLFFCAAIAIDIAALYSERRQLQNGADAAAVAIAQSCVRGLNGTSPTGPCRTALADLAGANALDGRADAVVCGTAPGLGSCPAPVTGSRASCDGPPAGSPPYVEVHTSTRTTGGTLVAPFFARALPGMADYDGVGLGACARSGYGSPSTAVSVLPVTVSQCVVGDYRTRLGGFAPLSLLDAGAAALRPWEIQIELHQDSGPCTTNSSGQTASGNFGFITPDTACSVTTVVGSSLQGKTGNSPPSGCTTSYMTARLAKVAYIPVFSTVAGSGSSVTYIVGYAAFYFTGWQLPGTSHNSILSGQPPCKKPTTCVAGVFVNGLSPTPGPISATSPQPSSLNTVQLLG